MINYRFPEATHTEDELSAALKLVGQFACDRFILDCTNGMTLRDEQGVAITGGWNNVAAYLMKAKTEARIEKGERQ